MVDIEQLLSLLLVLTPIVRVFLWLLWFPPTTKDNISKFQLVQEGMVVTFEGAPRELFGTQWVNKLRLHLLHLQLWHSSAHRERMPC